jgi:peptidoglycan/xylan/chitin deacetylase (PgdA/CDA1 family)
MTGRLLLVNYHYVRDDRYPYGGIHPVTLDAFSAQIDRLRARLHLAMPAEAEAFIRGSGGFSSPATLLTFDDGLRDHFSVARTVLEPLGLRGLFFVCSRPLSERRALTVQKIHWLRAMMPPSEFQSTVLKRVQKTLDAPCHSPAALISYPYDTLVDAQLKFLLNFVLPRSLVDAVTSEMLLELGWDEQEFCRDTYMSEEELRELHEAGHVIAAHGHSHVPLGQLDEPALTADVGSNLAFLERILGRRPSWISYPYGSALAIPQDTSSLTDGLGLLFGVTMSRGWIESGQQPMKLKRINCNELDAYLA